MTMFLLGVGSVIATGLLIALVADREFREAALEVLAAVAMAPLLLPLAITRRGPRCKRVSPAALERFCRQVDADMEPAWVLSYGGRGVIFVHRRRPAGWWRNNLPNRLTDATGSSSRSRRAEPINVRGPGE